MAGVQDAFANLQKDVQANYGVTLTNLAAFGVSGMMHGFLAFDENGRQLAQFRTWRNTMTAQAAEKLTACWASTSRSAGRLRTSCRR